MNPPQPGLKLYWKLKNNPPAPAVKLFLFLFFYKIRPFFHTFEWTWAALAPDMDTSSSFPSGILVSFKSTNFLLKDKDLFKVDESSLRPALDTPGYAFINIQTRGPVSNYLFRKSFFPQKLDLKINEFSGIKYEKGFKTCLFI